MVESAKYPPEIVIIVEDDTLSLSEIESFSSEYIYTMGSPVTITRRWGGPAASGPEIEIAVAVMAGQLLRQVASDAYELAKRHIAALYRKINPDSGARFYGDAAMALVTESDDGSVILRFCFPPGLTDAEVLERWHSVEKNWRRLSDEWSQRVREEGKSNLGGDGPVRVSLTLDATGEWLADTGAEPGWATVGRC